MPSGLRPVVWKGELVALAGRDQFHLIAPRLRTADARGDEIEYVALLCLYHRQVLLGRLPHSSNPAIAERWADAVLRLRQTDVTG